MLGLPHLFQALLNSLNGLRAAFLHETAFRQEVVLCLFLAPLGLWLGEGGVEKALLVGSLLGVLVVELLNSALEATVDRMGGGFHPLAKRAKDMASAAVLLSIVQAVLIWSLLLL